MIDDPPATATQYSLTVGVIDHHDGVVLVGDVDNPIQRGNVPIHGEHPVGDHKDAACPLGPRLGQPIGQGIDVAVRVDLAPRPGKANPVDDRGMVELIGDDYVLGFNERGDHRQVGGVSRLKRDGPLDPFEPGQRLLQVVVDGHGAGNGPDRPRPDPVPIERPPSPPPPDDRRCPSRDSCWSRS